MPFSDTGLSVDFNFEGLEGLIGNRGTNVIHERAIQCQCMTVDSTHGAVGHANPACNRCYGAGYLWRGPVRMIGLLTNITFNKNLNQLGWIAPGDLSFSPSVNNREIMDIDKIILTVPTPADSEIHVRGMSSFASPRPDELLSNEDLLSFEAGRPQAEWLEDEYGRVYRYGEYRLEGRKIIWETGASPSIGTKYTIRYMAYHEYICWATPMQRFDRLRKLGQKVMLRKTSTSQSLSTKQIQPPWQVSVENNMDGDYPYYTTDSPNSTDPSR